MIPTLLRHPPIGAYRNDKRLARIGSRCPRAVGPDRIRTMRHRTIATTAKSHDRAFSRYPWRRRKEPNRNSTPMIASSCLRDRSDSRSHPDARKTVLTASSGKRVSRVPRTPSFDGACTSAEGSSMRSDPSTSRSGHTRDWTGSSYRPPTTAVGSPRNPAKPRRRPRSASAVRRAMRGRVLSRADATGNSNWCLSPSPNHRVQGFARILPAVDMENDGTTSTLVVAGVEPSRSVRRAPRYDCSRTSHRSA